MPPFPLIIFFAAIASAISQTVISAEEEKLAQQQQEYYNQLQQEDERRKLEEEAEYNRQKSRLQSEYEQRIIDCEQILKSEIIQQDLSYLNAEVRAINILIAKIKFTLLIKKIKSTLCRKRMDVNWLEKMNLIKADLITKREKLKARKNELLDMR